MEMIVSIACVNKNLINLFVDLKTGSVLKEYLHSRGEVNFLKKDESNNIISIYKSKDYKLDQKDIKCFAFDQNIINDNCTIIETPTVNTKTISFKDKYAFLKCNKYSVEIYIVDDMTDFPILTSNLSLLIKFMVRTTFKGIKITYKDSVKSNIENGTDIYIENKKRK